jgi:hypothetical protein
MAIGINVREHIGMALHRRGHKSWKKLVMLPDSFEVSTSPFDLYHSPGDFYHSTRCATIQPVLSRDFEVRLSDASKLSKRTIKT